MVTKLDRDFVLEGLHGVQTAESVINALANEVERLEAGMIEALRIIKQAKAQFAPTTTNSDADMFLSQWG